MNTNVSPSHHQASSHLHKKILFVCLGNICRSPSAEGIFNYLAQQRSSNLRFVVDSAGTHDYHINKAPDPRAIRALQAVGIDISQLRGRQLGLEDFIQFDYLLVMDQRNLDFIRSFCPPQYLNKVIPIVRFYQQEGLKYIKDPYHGEAADFTTMVNELFPVCQQVLEAIEEDALSADQSPAIPAKAFTMANVD